MQASTVLLVGGGAALLASRTLDGASAKHARVLGLVLLAGGGALLAARASKLGGLGLVGNAIAGERVGDALAGTAGAVAETAELVAVSARDFLAGAGAVVLDGAARTVAGETVVHEPPPPVVVLQPIQALPPLIGLDGLDHGIVSGPNAMRGVLAAILDPLAGETVARPLAGSTFKARLALQNLTDEPRRPVVTAEVISRHGFASSIRKLVTLRDRNGKPFDLAPRARAEYPDVVIDTGSRFEIGDLDTTVRLSVDARLAQTLTLEVT